jgi:hypothetical protein
VPTQPYKSSFQGDVGPSTPLCGTGMPRQQRLRLTTVM